MINSKNAESFAGIIVGVFILSFVIIGITSILNYSGQLTSQYEIENNIWRLENNFRNIISKIDISGLNMHDEFFIYKNTSEQRFQIIPIEECIVNLGIGGNEDECLQYQFIDSLGNHIEDIDTHQGTIYTHRGIISSSDDSFGFSHQKFDIHISKYSK